MGDRGNDAAAVRQHFRDQAEHCRRLGSPFTAMLVQTAAQLLNEGSAVGRAVLNWPGDPRADALALRFAGSLHGLVLSGATPELADLYPAHRDDIRPSDLWAEIVSALAAHETTLLDWLQSPPQTNEVARCAVLIGGFATVAARTGRLLATLEIGASAGLNLHWDRYGYTFDETSWGAQAVPLRLEPEWRGAIPALGTIEVSSRQGCDRQPIDPGNAQDRLRLRGYIWPDQRARLERLDAALHHASLQSTRVERADAADWVDARLADRASGMATVLYHSIVWQYLPHATQRRIKAALDRSGAHADTDSPLAWLRMEPSPDGSRAELLLTMWPGGNVERLAYADYHGRWVEWLGSGAR